MQLHTSFEYRGKGIGKRLFDLCVLEAKSWGAKKLYISTHSADETQRFYRGIGCVDAVEINQKLADHEPFDCQLEYVLV
jgi:GNAT superfamily N-acetyltransferase